MAAGVRSMILESLSAQDRVYAQSDLDLARKLIDDPSRGTVIDATSIVLQNLKSEGLVESEVVPDDPNQDPRFRAKRHTCAYWLTAEGHQEVASLRAAAHRQ